MSRTPERKTTSRADTLASMQFTSPPKTKADADTAAAHTSIVSFHTPIPRIPFNKAPKRLRDYVGVAPHFGHHNDVEITTRDPDLISWLQDHGFVRGETSLLAKLLRILGGRRRRELVREENGTANTISARKMLIIDKLTEQIHALMTTERDIFLHSMDDVTGEMIYEPDLGAAALLRIKLLEYISAAQQDNAELALRDDKVFGNLYGSTLDALVDCEHLVKHHVYPDATTSRVDAWRNDREPEESQFITSIDQGICGSTEAEDEIDQRPIHWDSARSCGRMSQRTANELLLVLHWYHIRSRLREEANDPNLQLTPAQRATIRQRLNALETPQTPPAEEEAKYTTAQPELSNEERIADRIAAEATGPETAIDAPFSPWRVIRERKLITHDWLHSSIAARLLRRWHEHPYASTAIFATGAMIICCFTLPGLNTTLGLHQLSSWLSLKLGFTYYTTTALLVLVSLGICYATARSIKAAWDGFHKEKGQIPGTHTDRDVIRNEQAICVDERNNVEVSVAARNPIRRLWRGVKGFFRWFHSYGQKNPVAMTTYAVFFFGGWIDVLAPWMPGPLHSANMWIANGLTHLHAGSTTRFIGAMAAGFMAGKITLLAFNTIEKHKEGWLATFARKCVTNRVDMLIILALLVFGSTIEMGIPFFVAHIGTWLLFNLVTLNVKPGILILDAAENPRSSILGSSVLICVAPIQSLLGNKLAKFARDVWRTLINGLFDVVRFVLTGVIWPILSVITTGMMNVFYRLASPFGKSAKAAAARTEKKRIALHHRINVFTKHVDVYWRRIEAWCSKFRNIAALYCTVAALSAAAWLLSGNNLVGIFVPITPLAHLFHISTLSMAVATFLLAVGVACEFTPTAIHRLSRSQTHRSRQQFANLLDKPKQAESLSEEQKQAVRRAVAEQPWKMRYVIDKLFFPLGVMALALSNALIYNQLAWSAVASLPLTASFIALILLLPARRWLRSHVAGNTLWTVEQLTQETGAAPSSPPLKSQQIAAELTSTGCRTQGLNDGRVVLTPEQGGPDDEAVRSSVTDTGNGAGAHAPVYA